MLKRFMKNKNKIILTFGSKIFYSIMFYIDLHIMWNKKYFRYSDFGPT